MVHGGEQFRLQLWMWMAIQQTVTWWGYSTIVVMCCKCAYTSTWTCPHTHILHKQATAVREPNLCGTPSANLLRVGAGIPAKNLQKIWCGHKVPPGHPHIDNQHLFPQLTNSVYSWVGCFFRSLFKSWVARMWGRMRAHMHTRTRMHARAIYAWSFANKIFKALVLAIQLYTWISSYLISL